jgi:hypothetical protein
VADNTDGNPGKYIHTRSEREKECVEIAVNGTLMRGLELEPNLANLGAKFLREDYTESAYRLFSIDDMHPGMVRLPAFGLEKVHPVSVAVEIWCVPASGVATLLGKEPPGLSIGKIKLKDGTTEVLGVLAEPALIVGKKDISDFPGAGIASFRAYIIHEGMRIIDEALSQEPNLNESELGTVQTFRNAAGLLSKSGKPRGAIDLLNCAVKKLALTNRLFQNIPVGPASSFQLVQPAIRD